MNCISVFVFFKQKTSYEMRISDWSSDVCSSDLRRDRPASGKAGPASGWGSSRSVPLEGHIVTCAPKASPGDRKSVVSGKSVSVRVDLGGSRIIKKKNTN